jgi:transcriptional regulator with XRE-family HTH domain
MSLLEQTIGARIRLRRAEAGFSEVALAKLLNVSTGALRNIERGSQRIDAKALGMLADIFAVPVAYFFAPFDHPIDQ